ncbi:MAG: hypothetical protein N2246_08605 [Candidatus Sumerlaeia bacterium]|nr:hypothetical protein [Candidatus Sumerlaeia bacterium]
MKKPEAQISGGLVEILLSEGIISRAQVEEALQIQRSTDKPLVRILVEMGAITESAKMSILKKLFGYELVSLSPDDLNPKILSLIPRAIAIRHHVIPLRIEDNHLVLAMEDPSNLVLIDNLKALVGYTIRPVIASSSDIDEALKKYPAEEVLFKFRAPFLLRLLRGLFLPFLGLFLPIILTIFVLAKSEYLTIRLAKLQFFDFILYFLLGLGIWALIVWEIEGLLFKSKRK